jgi:hypothetical protein
MGVFTRTMEDLSARHAELQSVMIEATYIEVIVRLPALAGKSDGAPERSL